MVALESTVVDVRHRATRPSSSQRLSATRKRERIAAEAILQDLKKGQCTTVDLRTGKRLHRANGYVVAYKQPLLVAASTPEEAELVKILKKAGDRGFEYVGTWLDDDRKVYVERSRVFDDRDEAMAFARKQEQIAIYSYADDCCLEV